MFDTKGGDSPHPLHTGCSLLANNLSSLGEILLPLEEQNIFLCKKMHTVKNKKEKSLYKLPPELIKLLSKLQKEAVPYTHLIHELT